MTLNTSAPELIRQGSEAFSVGHMALAADLLGRAALLMKPDEPARLEFMPNLGSALARTGQLAVADAVLNEAINGAVAIADQCLASHARVERALWRIRLYERRGNVVLAQKARALLEKLSA
ncbi:MAG: hypothetical protein NVS1B3_17140 [Candidatus Dormibacteraceae bacterium]